MKKQYLFSLIAVAAFIFPNVANAQFGCVFNTSTEQFEAPNGGPCVNTIITAVPFLKIVPDARSGAMGDVGIAISPDANALHFNASKLAFATQDVGLSVTYTPWLRALNIDDVYFCLLYTSPSPRDRG